MLDPVTNFGKATVSTTYDDTATSIALTAGHGARFPDPASTGPFNLVWWNNTDYADPADDPNREIVRVTARSTDTLTVTRGQEGVTATTKNTAAKTYRMMLALTKKMKDDIGAGEIVPVATINNPPYAVVIDEANTNLVPNPSFEVDTTAWAANGASTAIARVTSQKYVGDASLEVVVSVAGASRGTVSNTIAVTASKTYVLSAWLKGASGAEALTMTLTGDNSGATSVNMAALTTTWRRFYISKTTNGSDTTVTIKFQTTGSTAPTFYVDGVQLEQKDNTGYATIFPTTYTDGSLGKGYKWSSTAHNSSSTREAGMHFLSPITAMSVSPFAMMTDGTIGGSRLHFKADMGDSGATGLQNNTGDPRAPFFFDGYQPNNMLSTGNIQALVAIRNNSTGPALYVKSATTSDAGMAIDVGSLTNGAGIAVYAPSDLSNMTGSFLKFADKSGANSYDFLRNAFIIGAPNLNYRHYMQGEGAGKYAKTSTNKTGTISSSGTTVTGTTTAFTTEFSVGDIISASGQERVITAIASDTSLTTLTAFNPVISGGTTPAKIDAQYEPFFLVLEGPNGDHQNQDYTDKALTLFVNGEDRPKIIRQAEAAGTGTISSSGTTVTGSSTAFTTQLSVGDVIIAANQRAVVLAIASNTSLTTRTAFSPVIGAGAAFTYINTTTTVSNPDLTSMRNITVAAPTADTDGKYFVLEEARETSAAGPAATTTETTLFTTAPTVAGGRMGTKGILRLTLSGTMVPGATSTLILRVKLGGTAVLTTVATAALATTNTFHWRLTADVANNASASAQNNSVQFFAEDQTTKAVTTVIRSETSTINTANDFTVDVTADFDTANGTMTCNYKNIELI